MARFSDSAKIKKRPASKNKTEASPSKKMASDASAGNSGYDMTFELVPLEVGECDDVGRGEGSGQGSIGDPWPGLSTELLDYADDRESAMRESGGEGFRPRVIIRIDDNQDGRADDRVPVTDLRQNPYDQICYLNIAPPQGGVNFVGTGWLIGSRVLVTAGHCVYNYSWENNGAYYGSGPARSITAYFGRNGSSSSSSTISSAIQFKVSSEWVQSQDRAETWDFAAVILGDGIGDSVGYFDFATFSDSDLLNMTVNIAGYPAEKGGYMFRHANRIAGVGRQRLEYTIDTTGGQSGSPVVCWHDSKNHVVGIHNYGDQGLQRNYATRINDNVFDRLMEWKDL